MVERAMQLSEVQGAAGRPAASMPPARRAGSGGRGGHGQSAGGQHGGWGEVPYGDVVSMGGQLWYEACSGGGAIGVMGLSLFFSPLTAVLTPARLS